MASQDVDGIKRALKMIENIIHEFNVGDVIEDAVVTRIENFGAYVDLLPGREALCRISQLSDRHIETVEDAVQIGDVISVKVIEIDDRGRLAVSHRAMLSPNDKLPRRSNGGNNRGGNSTAKPNRPTSTPNRSNVTNRPSNNFGGRSSNRSSRNRRDRD